MKPASIITLLLVVTAAQAAAEFKPASFEHEDSKKRLAARIEFPDVDRDATVTMICFSIIERSGKMTKTGCIAEDSFHAAFAAAVMKASKKAALSPAVIDGKAQTIYLQFRVEFTAKDDDRKIVLYHNPGYQENVDAYGNDYFAAQRVVGKEPWQDICPQRATYLVLVRAFVSEEGRAESPSLERVSGIMPAPDCQEAIKETILASAYTPAMAEGSAVPSAYVEMFSN